MKKWISELSGWYRFAIVMSLIWIIGALIGVEPWHRHYNPFLRPGSGGAGSYRNLDDFLLIGVLPVVIFWGLIWVIKGFRKKS